MNEDVVDNLLNFGLDAYEDDRFESMIPFSEFVAQADGISTDNAQYVNAVTFLVLDQEDMPDMTGLKVQKLEGIQEEYQAGSMTKWRYFYELIRDSGTRAEFTLTYNGIGTSE